MARAWSLKSFFRWRLRTILVVVTLVAVALGVAEVKIMRYTRQRRVRLELEKAGAAVVSETVDTKWIVDLFGEERMQKVVDVSLTENVKDRHLELMLQLPDLERFVVGTLPMNRQDTVQSGRFQDAKYLNFTECDIGDRGMLAVAKCTHLETLFLVNTKVTDKGLRSLEKLKKLRVVWLRGTQVTPAGVRALKQKLPNSYIHFPVP